jgi:hypothetical protein
MQTKAKLYYFGQPLLTDLEHRLQAVKYRPGTFGHLLRESTINGIAVNSFPRWLVGCCYGLILFGLYLAILKGIPWFALLFAAIAFFLLFQYGLKPAQKLIRFLEHNDHAWVRYSGIPLENLDPKLLNTSIDVLDERRARYQRALQAKDGQSFRDLMALAEEEVETEAAPPNALEAMQQHLRSWDSSLFFAGSSRTGKTSATQHYAAILQPYYFSLKPDFMPKGVKGVQGALEEPDQLYYWILPFYREFKYRVKNRLENEHPLWIFVDELETNLASLERWQEQQPKGSQNLYKEAVGMMNGILKLGNAHQVRFGFITQSVLSKNTRLDSDLMAALAWLFCGSELGGFGAFKSDRIKARCSEQTLGQVKMMVDHPDGVRGFWWLMELRGNFRLLQAPALLPATELERIPHYEVRNHPFQGRSLLPEQDREPLPEPQPPAAAPTLFQTAKTGLQRMGEGIKHALGVESDFQPTAVAPAAAPVDSIGEELAQLRSLFTEDREALMEFDAIAPLIPNLNEAMQGIVLFSLRNGAVTSRHMINFAPGRRKLYRPLKAEGVKQLFSELDSMGIGVISQSGSDDPNPYYQALTLDGRTFSPNS